MTSRERLHCATDHKEPDRVPVDLGSNPSSGISASAYYHLNEFLGYTDSETRIYDVVQELAEPEDHILERFNIDVIDVGRAFTQDNHYWHETELTGGIPARYPHWFHPTERYGEFEVFHPDGTLIAKKPSGANFYDQTMFPFVDGYPESFDNLSDAMGHVPWSALVHSPWDQASHDSFWEDLRSKSRKLAKTTDYGLMIVAGCNLFEWGTFLRRMDNFLMDLYTDEPSVERLLDALMEIHMNTLQKVCDAVGDTVDVIRFGDDLGLDSGEFFSPEIYAKLFKPHHKTLCDYVHKNSNMRTFLHSCGSIYRVLPDLIDAGFEIINPVQTNALNMEPEKLKREFGSDICFWGGGADTRFVLNRATPDEVKEHVTRRIEIFAPGGGFVFNTIHNILPDVPPENIIAMFEAVEECQ